MIIIREAAERDAAKLLELHKQIDRETKFMLLEPDERTITAERQSDIIRSVKSAVNSTILVAEDEETGKLAGHLSAIGGSANRISHRAYVVIGILKEYAGRGVGTKLFEALEEWRKGSGIHRFELTVMVENERGVKLYQKMGFAIEGIKKNSMVVDGNSVDEYYMGKTFL